MRPLYVGIVVGLLGVLVVAGASGGFTAVYSDRAVDAQTVPDSQGYLGIVGDQADIDPFALQNRNRKVLGLESPGTAPDVGTENLLGGPEVGPKYLPPICEATITNNYGEELDVTVRHLGFIPVKKSVAPGEDVTFYIVTGEFFDVEATGEYVEFDADRVVRSNCAIEPVRPYGGLGR